MSFHRPSVLQTFLKDLSKAPKKSLSQNFLIDGNIIQKLLACSDIQKDDVVLEIGPGPGAITQALLTTGAKVIAIEKDATFAKALSRLDTDKQALTILCEDFLTIDLRKILEKERKKVKVVSNLPFSLTSPILEKLFSVSSHIDSISVIMQKEVGQRFTAKPKTPHYSSFSVFVQLYTKPKYIHTISPNSFYPKPKVHSAILFAEMKKNLSKLNLEDICHFVRKIFQKKRKMLVNSLKELCTMGQLHDILKELNIEMTARPADLSPEDYISLFQALSRLKVLP